MPPRPYACRFCRHAVLDHNQIEGCPHCWCAGTSHEAAPCTDAEFRYLAILPGAYAPGYEPREKTEDQLRKDLRAAVEEVRSAERRRDAAEEALDKFMGNRVV